MVLSFIEIDPKLVPSFMRAAEDGDVSKVVDMVEAGMPVDIVDKWDHTAPRSAACTNRTDVIRYLLDKTANVDKQDSDAWTALSAVNNNNNTDVIRILLQHGTRKDIKNNDGNTPIDVARRWNYKETVGLLKQY